MLDQLIKQPSQENLQKFKNACRNKQWLHFESDESDSALLHTVVKTGNGFLIRAVVYAENHCTDGADRESVLMALGSDILVEHSSALIDALFAENRWKDFADLGEQENEEWLDVECEEQNLDCQKRRKAYFASKRQALENAKIPQDQEVVRSALLNGLKSDR